MHGISNNLALLLFSWSTNILNIVFAIAAMVDGSDFYEIMKFLVLCALSMPLSAFSLSNFIEKEELDGLR